MKNGSRKGNLSRVQVVLSTHLYCCRQMAPWQSLTSPTSQRRTEWEQQVILEKNIHRTRGANGSHCCPLLATKLDLSALAILSASILRRLNPTLTNSERTNRCHQKGNLYSKNRCLPNFNYFYALRNHFRFPNFLENLFSIFGNLKNLSLSLNTFTNNGESEALFVPQISQNLNESLNNRAKNRKTRRMRNSTEA